MGNSTRNCAKCGANSADVPFKKDKRAHDGLGAYCIPCQREYQAAYYAANKVKLNAENTARYAENKDRYRAQQEAYRAENIERIRAYDRERYAADPEGRSAHVADWVALNREKLRAHKKRYHATNRDRMMDAQAANRIAHAGLGAVVQPIVRRDVWEAYGRACGVCGDPLAWEAMELDHIYPISKGGNHTYENVQPAHKPCNAGKRDKIIT